MSMHPLKTSFAVTAIVCAFGVQAADRTVIQNKGSDTLVNVAQAWAENYKEINPNVDQWEADGIAPLHDAVENGDTCV